MKTKRWVRWLALFIVVPLLVPWIGIKTAWQIRKWLAAQTPGLTVRTIEIDGQRHRFAVVEPDTDRFNGPRPLVVFLHSATECGTDGILPAIKIAPAFLKHARQEAGALILLPQFPRHDQGWNLAWHPLVFQLIERVKQEHAVDPDRVYLVGMSLGGQGCWQLAADRPDFFAAAVPMCGNGPTTLASNLERIPIWAFHGSDDSVIPAQGSRDLVAAIKGAGGQLIRYTEFEGIGHNCWDRAMTDPQLLNWLFRQCRDATRNKQSTPSD